MAEGLKIEKEDNEACNCTQKDRRQGCADLGPRNRRSEIRLGDIHRIVNKAMDNIAKNPPAMFGGNAVNTERTACGARVAAEQKYGARRFKEVPSVNPELKQLLAKAQTVLTQKWDKNTPESLEQLRWEIYDLIERYEGDYGRMISMLLRHEIEKLFKRYTHS